MCTEISNQENEEMSWPEKDICIKCDRGGKVLVCSDSNCPIVVHEKCMACPARFDDRGNFYCPYCLYRQANEESRKVREDVMLKKQALSRFLDKEMIIGNKLVQPSIMRKSPSKRADESSPEEHTGLLRQSKCNNYSRENRCDNHLTVVGCKTKSGPNAACGFESSDEQGATQKFRIVQVSKGIQTEHEPEVDDQQIDRDVEDCQQEGHLSEIPEREKEIMKKSNRVPEENEVGEIPERGKEIRKKSKRVLAENEPEVGDLQLERDVEDHKKDGHLSEIPEREKKIRKKAKRVLAENEPEVDAQRLDRDFEDHQEDGHLSVIPEREKKIRKKAKQMRAENEPEVDDVEDHQEDGNLSEMPERGKKICKKAKPMVAENEPEVDDQLLDRGIEDHQKDDRLTETSDREKKIRRKQNQMPAENEPEADDQLLDRHVEDRQEDGHLREIPEREENIMKKATQMQAGRKENEDGGGAEADQMQGKARESAASFMNEEPESQLHMKAKRRDETGASISREFEAVRRRSIRIKIKKPGGKKKICENAKEMLAENEPEVDDQLLDRDVENRQEDGHSGEIPEREENIMKKPVQMQSVRKKNEAGGGAEAEQMQGKTRKSAAPFMNEEPESQLYTKAKRRDETGASISREFEAVRRLSNRIKIKKPDGKKKVWEKAKQLLAENEPEVADQLLDRDVENRQEDGHLREIPEREKNIMKKPIRMQAERKEDETGGGAEVEQMQGKTRESDAPFVNEEPESQVHMKAKRRDETGASTSRNFEAVLRRSNHNTENNETEDQPLNSDSIRSSQTACKAKEVSGLTGETSAPDNSTQAEERNQFPNGRRKKLMWSHEEEDMLQEGIHQFSATVNKNIPWRKILDYGRNVFHPTRTPVDLKDKWRTMCGR